MTRNREAWLQAAVKHLLKRIGKATAFTPVERVAVSCGFPRSDRNGKVIGECWVGACSKDGTHQVFISPTIHESVQVLATLLHELLHACDDCHNGHNATFAKACKALGFAGKPTATFAEEGSELYADLYAIAAKLGPYPHGSFTPGGGLTKKQGTRLVKCECSECGYTVRTTNKWLAVAVPTCPDENCEGYQFSLTVEEKDE